jgi:hypothetical protein
MRKSPKAMESEPAATPSISAVHAAQVRSASHKLFLANMLRTTVAIALAQ